MKPNRRRFLSLLGVGAAAGPLAVKAATDAEIGSSMGMLSIKGFGSTALGLAGFSGPPAQAQQGPNISYEKRLIDAADYIKMFGVPEVMEFELRDQARYVGSFDPDIACKQSWSMAVKIMTQRERNYQRAVERVEKSGWQQRKRSALKTILGFEWPW